MTLTKLPGSKWWVETDDVSSEIIGTYNKAFITADIQAINATLATKPDPTQEATDVNSALTAITNTGWTQARKDRVSALVTLMFQEHQGTQEQLDVANLIDKRDALIDLRNRLV